MGNRGEAIEGMERSSGTLPPEDPAAAKARELEESPPEAVEVPAARDPAWGARVILAGLAAIVIALALTVAFFNNDAKDVIAITGPTFAVISGLVAAYFGIRAGSLATERMQGTVNKQPPPAMSEKQQGKLLAKNGRG